MILVLTAPAACGAAEETSVAADPRNVQTGFVIPDEGYCDQPYVVITKDGSWLCVLTTGKGREGQRGQHVVSTISRDQGRSWSKLLDIEPASGPEASWAVPLVTPGGRVYVFYDYNGDKIGTLRDKPVRADMLGWYCYRFSDDHGASWSPQRYRLPVRVTDCDRRNDWGGAVQIFWGISKPVTSGNSALFGFTKLGKHLLDDGEGWFFRSDNILTETDPEKLDWKMLPDGERGVRNERFGSVQEEHNLVPLSGDDFYCIYRTTTGAACQSYSRDGGHTWSEPEHATYSPGGRTIKHPRACPKLWKTANGRFLFWFHNHGGKTFEGRNPAWICGGVERDGNLYWSQPEVVLFDPDPKIRMSYPDLIEQDGHYWITETQKTVARVHPIDPALLNGLWRQLEPTSATGKIALPAAALPAATLAVSPEQLQAGAAPLPRLRPLDQGGGFSIAFRVRLGDAPVGQVLLDASDGDITGFTRGWRVTAQSEGRGQLEASDGRARATWTSDKGALRDPGQHHVVITVDGGPKIITMLVDGVLGDGGSEREVGWGRFDSNLRDLHASDALKIAAPAGGALSDVRLYEPSLRNFEAVELFRSSAAAQPQ